MNMFCARRVLCVTALLLMTIPAHAQLATFVGFDTGAGSTDPRPNSVATEAAFDAAAGALGAIQVIDFENCPVGGFTSLNPVAGVTVTGSDFYGSAQTIQNAAIGTPDGLYGYNTTAGGQYFLSLFGGSATFTFADPIMAFGCYISGVQMAGETVTFSDGTSQTIAIPGISSGITYIGFTDAGKAISSVTIHAEGDIDGVDDVHFVVGQVPEPGSLALLVGLSISGGLLVLRRRTR